MEVWVQTSFLADTPATRPATRAHRQSGSGARGRREARIDRSRVSRDPAVASSHAKSTVLASDFRQGLAIAFARLSAEQRAAIRSVLTERAPRTAA